MIEKHINKLIKYEKLTLILENVKWSYVEYRFIQDVFKITSVFFAFLALLSIIGFLTPYLYLNEINESIAAFQEFNAIRWENGFDSWDSTATFNYFPQKELLDWGSSHADVSKEFQKLFSESISVIRLVVGFFMIFLLGLFDFKLNTIPTDKFKNATSETFSFFCFIVFHIVFIPFICMVLFRSNYSIHSFSLFSGFLFFMIFLFLFANRLFYLQTKKTRYQHAEFEYNKNSLDLLKKETQLLSAELEKNSELISSNSTEIKKAVEFAEASNDFFIIHRVKELVTLFDRKIKVKKENDSLVSSMKETLKNNKVHVHKINNS